MALGGFCVGWTSCPVASDHEPLLSRSERDCAIFLFTGLNDPRGRTPASARGGCRKMSMAPSRALIRNLPGAPIGSAAAEEALAAVADELRVACASPTLMSESAPARSDISSGLEAACLLDNDDTYVGESPPIASQIAAVIAGIATIGEACNALRHAGFGASIAGNRISVDENLSVQYLGIGGNAAGSADPVWVVFSSASEPPTLVAAMNHRG